MAGRVTVGTVAWGVADEPGTTCEDDVDFAHARGRLPSGGDLGEAVAAALFERNASDRGWTDLPEGDGKVVVVTDPPEAVGTYAVVVDAMARGGVQAMATRVAALDAESRAAADRRAMEGNPAAVERRYDFLGSVYGDGIPDTAGDARMSLLKAGYDDCRLHSLGLPVRLRDTGEVGVLVMHREDEADPLPGAAERLSFLAELGAVPEPVTRWLGRDASFTVAFVRIERLHTVDEVHQGLVAIATRPSPAP